MNWSWATIKLHPKNERNGKIMCFGSRLIHEWEFVAVANDTGECFRLDIISCESSSNAAVDYTGNPSRGL